MHQDELRLRAQSVDHAKGSKRGLGIALPLISDALPTVTMKTALFWDVAMCNLVDRH